MNKKTLVKALISLVCFICLALFIEAEILQLNNNRQVNRTSNILLNQIENIITENENSEAEILESLKEDYIQKTRTVAYILGNDEKKIDNADELNNIMKMLDIDEINIFDADGTIYAGTVPEYFGYSFDSGEQISFFKPMLSDKTLTMCQDVTPNTAEEKSMMYSIAWDSSGRFMVQLGIEPVRLLKEFEKNRISDVVSKIPVYEGSKIFVSDIGTGIILGSSDKSQVGKTAYECGYLSENDDVNFIQSKNITLDGYRNICNYRHHGQYLLTVVHSTRANLENFLTAMLIEFSYLLVASGVILIIIMRLSGANEDIKEQISVLSSMSHIYYSLHVINLKEDTVKTYLSSGIISKIVNHKKGAADIMKRVISEVTKEEYTEAVLAFTDLKTLADRMGDKKVISCEFEGKNIGWCIAFFIVISKDKNGKPEKVVFVTRDVDSERRKEENLILTSNTDELTGLFNRRAYEDDMMNYPDVPPEMDFVYASIDINGLKVVNDSLGHSAGDELIIGAASVLKRTLGNYGRVYRVGGDEFVAMFFADEKHLNDVLGDMQLAADSWRGSIVDELAFSVGFVTKREFMTETVREMAEVADQRMYENKERYYSQKGVDRRGQAAAHKALCGLYTKILKINITDDTYSVVNMDMSEQTSDKGFAGSISGWLSGFGKSGQVYAEDLDEYLEKTDIEYLRNYFRSEKTSISIHYRRKYSDGFKQVIMEMIPADDYSDEHQTLFLYVKNIDK